MGPYVPPGQSPPFEVVDDFHHGAWIIITAALGLVVSLVCLLIRLYVRLMLIPPFAQDDFILLVATVSSPYSNDDISLTMVFDQLQAVGIVQSILIFFGTRRCTYPYAEDIESILTHPPSWLPLSLLTPVLPSQYLISGGRRCPSRVWKISVGSVPVTYWRSCAWHQHGVVSDPTETG